MQGRRRFSAYWIRVAMPAALLAMVCLLLILSRYPTVVDERSYLFWIW